jgi:hypothetical protein
VPFAYKLANTFNNSFMWYISWGIDTLGFFGLVVAVTPLIAYSCKKAYFYCVRNGEELFEAQLLLPI